MIRQRKRKTTNSPSLLLNLHNFIKGQSVCLYLIFSFVCGSKLKMWKIRVRGIMKIWKKCVDEWVFQATLAVTGIRSRNMYARVEVHPIFILEWISIIFLILILYLYVPEHKMNYEAPGSWMETNVTLNSHFIRMYRGCHGTRTYRSINYFNT